MKEGQKVKKEQNIGEQGQRENSTASHAHIVIHMNNARIHTMEDIDDPSSIMKIK